MQRRRDPAVPQTLLEQQFGSAGVSTGQEGGKWSKRGAAFAGIKAGCALVSSGLVLAAGASQPLATTAAVGERHGNLRPKYSSICITH